MNKLYYRVIRTQPTNKYTTESYEHLIIEVWESTSGFSREEVIDFRWQATLGQIQLDNYWYGMKIESAPRNFDGVRKINKIVNRIRGQQDVYRPSPEWVLDRLETINSLRVEYDNRLSDWVGENDVLPSRVRMWAAKINGHYHGHTLAVEQDAHKMVVRSLKDRFRNGSISIRDILYQDIEAWEKSGTPVNLWPEHKDPYFHPIDQLLAPPENTVVK